ncbi:Protein CBG08650 [Caenorhabditis briggsae]|uniref:BPTI/Kunitz inhibitor domain-containing protein n=2 Tax=Caenorhabditis briggsae TaxID=6238 RepID=A0AAE9A094_CAEBR|nr:Protein CBG08650 [Caenorhabditis briggsae]ULT88461.1 hypothetical protein L3Y34_007576 [Caenorhabditis briggsae]CAP28376.1 Protein CBG08650 [Caenorhabditis briggsae]
MNSKIALLLSILVVSYSVYCEYVRPAKCNLYDDWGTNPCSKESSIRFYYDPSMDKCLAFRFSGCGGNENSFTREYDCHRECYDPDRMHCPGNTTATLTTAGTTHPCGSGENKKGLPTCVSTAEQLTFCNPTGPGICCRTEVRYLYTNDSSPSGHGCPGGEEMGMKYLQDGKAPLAKNCSREDFCPKGYTCTKGNYYSYCCK